MKLAITPAALAAALLFSACSKGTAAPGDPGPAGPAGPAGAKGPKGDQGPQGIAGASVTGASVPPGDGFCPTGGVKYTSADGDHYVCNGAPGPTGAQGLKGDTGPAGAPGAPGMMGPMGPQGAVGATGPQGATGATGATGRIAAVNCPTGQVMQAIDGSGSPVCVQGGDVAPPPLANRIGLAANKLNTYGSTSEWNFVSGFAVPFISAGGPVQVTANLSVNGPSGDSATCRTLVDGIPAGVFDGQDTSYIWQNGIRFVGNGWQLWSVSRSVPNVPPGRHLVTVQCKGDTGQTIFGYGSSIETVSVIPYGDPATSEAKAYTASARGGQTIGCCSFSSIPGLATQFSYQGGPVRISLSIPLSGGSHSACRPLIDGAPAASEPVDSWSGTYWNEGLEYTYPGWTMWNRTRLYNPATWSSPLSIGAHTATVECRTDSATVSVGNSQMSSNLSVVTYKPANDSAATIHAVGASTRTVTNFNGNWTTLAGLSATFTSNGGPVEVGLSLPISNVGGSNPTGTCRPLIDGAPVAGDAASTPDDWNNFWNEGLQFANSGWAMWNRVRMYRGVAAGQHTLTAQCRNDNSTVSGGYAGQSVNHLWAIAYDQ